MCDIPDFLMCDILISYVWYSFQSTKNTKTTIMGGGKSYSEAEIKAVAKIVVENPG